MLSKEELLKPRFKVIADYPGSDYHIGEILDRDWGWCGNDEIGFKHSISQYPHLFKELEWWDDRNESDMPEYLLCICRDFIKFKIGQIIAVEKHFSNTFNQRVNLFISKEKQSHEAVTNCFSYKDFLPATKSEYEQYLSEKK